MLLKTYLVVGAAVCLWFATASALGWKAPSFGGSGFGSSGTSYGPSGGGGVYFPGGGRSTSGSGGWGGGK